MIKDCTVPQPYLVTCPLNVAHPVMLPSEFTMWLLDIKKVTLSETTNLSQGTLVTLSSTLAQTCQTQHVPHYYTLALGLHCDGVASTQVYTQPCQLCCVELKHDVLSNSIGLCSQHFPNNTIVSVGFLAGTNQILCVMS